MVAGNALNENVVHEIESRGLAFRPIDGYRSQLSTAGADARVLAALGKATISSAAGDKDSSELLQHLSAAGNFLRAKQYQEAAQELDSALQSGGGPETGFVMRELLKVQEQWQMAASVYEQVLKQEPDFPETHTKLGYLMYRLGNPEEGLREARVAQASSSALMQRQWDEAVRSYKQAVKLAEKLQPHDGRLAIALGELGRITMGLQQFAEADSFFHRQMKVTEELYGPQSPMLSEPLQNLGMEASAQQDVASALQFFNRAIELNVKAYGENRSGVSNSLRMLAGMYAFQKDFANAEPILLRAVKIDETLYGHDGSEALFNLTALCGTYDLWGKPEKSEPCYEHLLAVLERQYGPDNPIIVPALTSQALRSLGRNHEATKIEQHIKTIQATAMNQN